MTTSHRFRSLKIHKTWLVLGVALTIGTLAALAARNYLSNQMDAIEAKERGNKVNVVVAKRDLRRGEKLSADNVAVRPVPVDYAHSNAVAPGTFERLDGQLLAFPVKAGEMVLWSLVEGKKAPTFSARVEAGRRAITVPVDEINSISGMLEPGDTIDLIVSVDRKGRKMSLPLLQGVQVMATGQRSIDDPKSGERRQYSTVTLDTTPEQAQNVILAREAGRITALLRNPQDKQTVAVPSAQLAALLVAAPESAPPLPTSTPERQVPVLYGGRSGKLPSEGLRLGQYVAPSADTSGMDMPSAMAGVVGAVSMQRAVSEPMPVASVGSPPGSMPPPPVTSLFTPAFGSLAAAPAGPAPRQP